MSRRNDFEDDGRTIADMSGLESSPHLFRRRPRSSQTQEEYGNQEGNGSALWEDAPISWKERLHYAGMALGAALAIALVFIVGLGVVIWLITLYG